MDSDSFILNLSHLSREISLDDFKHAVMEELENYIPFDSGIWIEGRPGESFVYEHSRMLYNQPEEMMASYFTYAAEKDFLAAAAINTPNRAIDIDHLLPREQLEEHDIYRFHMCNFGMEHCVCIALEHSNGSVFSFLSLYRRNRGVRFEENERLLFERVAPHMLECYKTVLWHSAHTMKVFNGDDHQPAAFSDRYGVVHQYTSGWESVFNKVDASWDPNILPVKLREALDNGTGLYRLNSYYKIKVEPTIHDLWLLQLHARSPLDDLSSAEYQVAELYAAGKSLKMIARELGKSYYTVRNQVNSAYNKLGIREKSLLAKLIAKYGDV